MGRSNLLTNANGFSLIEGLVAAAILSIVAVSVGGFFQSSTIAKTKNDVVTSVIKYRYSIITTLRSPDGAAKAGLVNGVPCLATHLSCAPAATAYAPLTVQNSLGINLTDKDDASSGFGLDMATCTSFPSSVCPFRYETEWRSLCNAANPVFCNSPQLKVRGTLKIAPDFGVPLNQSMYSFEITLGQVLGTYEQSCTSIGGTYLPGNPPRCGLPLGGDCPPTQIVVGYNKATRTKICKPFFQAYLNNVVVPPGNVIIGIGSNGDPIWRPMRITTAPFPAQIVPNVPSGALFGDGGAGPLDGGCGGSGGGGCQ